MDVTLNPLRSVLVGIILLVGCSSSPPPRLDLYVESLPQQTARLPAGPIETGLVVINDTSASRSAPALSLNALAFLTQQIRIRVEQGLPIKIVKVLPAPEIQPTGTSLPLLSLAREHDLTYLLVAVFSSAESDVPRYFPLDGAPEQGGSRPKVAGYETSNYALAELALLGVERGQVVTRAMGRAWSTLDHLYAPVKSNSYPVIHRSLRIPPIYPPQDSAKDVLRSVAADEALEQAVLQIQRQQAASG